MTSVSPASFDDLYAADWAPRSGELFRRAQEVIPGGAGSSARTVKFGWKPYPPFIAEGQGSRLRDVDGHEYIDYLLGLGPMILGHRHPVVTEAVVTAVRDLGTCFGLPYELEIEAAAKVVDAVPGIEMVRFTNSGSEAVGSAVRIARAVTGRRIVIRFEGLYHGWQDTVYWSNHVDPAEAGPADRPRPVKSGPGVPQELADTLIVLSWNDPESFVRVMAERGDEVARVDGHEVLGGARECLQTVHVVRHGDAFAGHSAGRLVHVPRRPGVRTLRHHARIGVQDNLVAVVLEAAEGQALRGVRVAQQGEGIVRVRRHDDGVEALVAPCLCPHAGPGLVAGHRDHRVSGPDRAGGER